MRYKIVADSSADILHLEKIEFEAVPLHIIVGDMDFADDGTVDCEYMHDKIDHFDGKTTTACPAPDEWIKAFGDADVIFCITLTSKLSGACSSANIAKQIFEEQNPTKKVYIFDSLTTGPEMALMLEKLAKCIEEGNSEEVIVQKLNVYRKHTHLLFSLASVKNFANNGRISHLLAKGIGVLGIRIVGKASDQGELQPIDKARGDSRAIDKIINNMIDMGYCGGRVKIAHNCNEKSARQLADVIQEKFTHAQIDVNPTHALCSYYAEKESILVGFES